MPITDPAAIRFVNERIRPLADRLARMNALLALLLGEWDAKGMADLIPDDAAAAVEDGRASEGIVQVTGADVRDIVKLAQTLYAWANDPAASKVPAVLKVAVNPSE